MATMTATEEETMITVTCDQTGDWAEAEDALAALVAARALLEDAYRAWSVQGYDPTATFAVGDEPVVGMSGVGQPAIWHALGAAGYRS